MDPKIKDSLVTFQTSQGLDLRGGLTRLGRFQANFEIYHPSDVLRASEVLTDFRIVAHDRTLYSGRAVIRSVVGMGGTSVCEATLDEASWIDIEFNPGMVATGALRQSLSDFLQEWQKLYRVVPEYKVMVADMQTFLQDFRLWLDQVELGIRSSPSGDRLKLEQDVVNGMSEAAIPAINVLFQQFERIAGQLEPEGVSAHHSFMRRQLHPLVLCAPFAYRAFSKPLGYAGDYELVNMMVREEREGSSLFAKVINTWFVRQPPAEAHRNRITYLTEWLVKESLRAKTVGKRARIFNLACGPAQEIQKFIAESPLSSQTSVTLLDFNEETLAYTRETLGRVRSAANSDAELHFVKKSVQHILKESSRSVERADQNQYDMVYCAGLFDYLSDQVCQRLLNLMYEWLAPGGLLIATNVEPLNPLRYGMEHLLDWHLIYRTGPQLRALAPKKAPADSVNLRSDITGYNVFLEVRKPGHAD
jgi:extracellular factor (EF) 3-hydroxypalmitic acid methyl ester biosynthesis protein